MVRSATGPDKRTSRHEVPHLSSHQVRIAPENHRIATECLVVCMHIPGKADGERHTGTFMPSHSPRVGAGSTVPGNVDDVRQIGGRTKSHHGPKSRCDPRA